MKDGKRPMNNGKYGKKNAILLILKWKKMETFSDHLGTENQEAIR